jgi:hypothetical protein
VVDTPQLRTSQYDAQANLRVDRLDKKYPQWARPVHGTTPHERFELSVTTAENPARATRSTGRRRYRR